MTSGTGTLHDVMVISRSVLLIKRKVSEKIAEEIKTHIFRVITMHQ